MWGMTASFELTALCFFDSSSCHLSCIAQWLVPACGLVISPVCTTATAGFIVACERHCPQSGPRFVALQAPGGSVCGPMCVACVLRSGVGVMVCDCHHPQALLVTYTGCAIACCTHWWSSRCVTSFANHYDERHSVWLWCNSACKLLSTDTGRAQATCPVEPGLRVIVLARDGCSSFAAVVTGGPTFMVKIHDAFCPFNWLASWLCPPNEGRTCTWCRHPGFSHPGPNMFQGLVSTLQPIKPWLTFVARSCLTWSIGRRWGVVPMRVVTAHAPEYTYTLQVVCTSGMAVW